MDDRESASVVEFACDAQQLARPPSLRAPAALLEHAQTILDHSRGCGARPGAFALFSWSCYPAIPEEGDNTFGVDVNQEQHDAKSFGLENARIDSQLTFRIPDGQADAVYE